MIAIIDAAIAVVRSINGVVDGFDHPLALGIDKSPLTVHRTHDAESVMVLEGNVVEIEIIANRESSGDGKFTRGIDERDETFLIDRRDAFAEVPCTLVLRRNDNLPCMGVQIAAFSIIGSEDNEAVIRCVLVDEDVVQARRGKFTGADVFELIETLPAFVTVHEDDIRRHIFRVSLPVSDFEFLFVIDVAHEAGE